MREDEYVRVPEAIEPLVEQGLVDEVVCPLMSGKEAQVFLVMLGTEMRVAKVYKDADQRSFKNRAGYIEGRKTRSSREERAMTKGSRHGREQTEAAWRSAEVDAIYRLKAAGVRVPDPYAFIEGVLLMEFVCDPEGNPAPRLGDISMGEAAAVELFEKLVREVVKMLCAGLVHGDLSEYNILWGATGPVIIDFPQTVDAAQNRNARDLLIRDVGNLMRFLGGFAPALRGLQYGQEMWDLYERGELFPDTPLTGRFKGAQKVVNTTGLLAGLREEELEAIRRGINEPKRKRRRNPSQPVASPGERPPLRVPAPPLRQELGRLPDRPDRPANSPAPIRPPAPRADPRPPLRDDLRNQPRNEPRPPLRAEPRNDQRDERHDPRAAYREPVAAPRNDARGQGRDPYRDPAPRNEPRAPYRDAPRSDPRPPPREAPRNDRGSDPRPPHRDAPRNEPRVDDRFERFEPRSREGSPERYDRPSSRPPGDDRAPPPSPGRSTWTPQPPNPGQPASGRTRNRNRPR